MARIYTIEIKSDGSIVKPAGLKNAKPGDHIHFKCPGQFAVTMYGDSPFHGHTFTQDNPCTGPLRAPFGRKHYIIHIVKKKPEPFISPHPIPIP